MNENKEIISAEETSRLSIDEMLRIENYISPLVDIIEMPDEFVLTANMPGISRKNIQVKVDDKSLVIFGKIDYTAAVDNKFILNENEIGNYYRQFNISDTIDETKIEAKYDNGQLVLRLPKHDKAKLRTINID
ncbi:MAG: Hsp20/alpha crystallin family protein [Ignavibacteria bacterium]|nr:Hsp20/alpha crystallin family protein [Ignavibacteria bacterium]